MNNSATVLIVEDEAITGLAMEIMLKRKGSTILKLLQPVKMQFFSQNNLIQKLFLWI